MEYYLLSNRPSVISVAQNANHNPYKISLITRQSYNQIGGQCISAYILAFKNVHSFKNNIFRYRLPKKNMIDNDYHQDYTKQYRDTHHQKENGSDSGDYSDHNQSSNQMSASRDISILGDHQLTNQTRRRLLRRKKAIIFWLYLGCVVVFLASILGLMSSAYEPIERLLISDSYYFARQVVSEWHRGFITDLLITKAPAGCPTGYEQAINYNWRGSGFGCHCISGTNVSFVLQGYCSPALIQNNCTNLPREQSRQAHFWKNSSNICLKRSTVSSFAQEKKYDGGVANRKCGSSQSLVVVPVLQPCPLVNLSISSPFSHQDNVITANDLDQVLPPLYAATNSTSPFSFYSYPLSKLAVSEHEFCQIDEDTGLSPDHRDFVLLSISKGCAQKGNYTTIDQTTQFNFYQNNPQLQALTTIPGFPEAGNWEYKLGFAPIPSWTYSCRHNLEGKFTIQQATYKLRLQRRHSLLAMSIIVIICCVVLAGLVLVLAVRRCVDSAIYPVGFRKQRMDNQFCGAVSRYVIDLVCKLLILTLVLVFLFTSYTDWHWFKEALNQKCHHDNLELASSVLAPYQVVHKTLLQSSIAMVCLALVMILIDWFHFAFMYKNELRYYLVESNQKLVASEHPLEEEPPSGHNLQLGSGDLKWLEVNDEAEQLDGDRNIDKDGADQFLRITMAQNLFSNDSAQESHYGKTPKPARQSVLGKKGSPLKKHSPLKKKKKSNKEKNQVLEGGVGRDYLFEDDTFAFQGITTEQLSVINVKSTSGSSAVKQRSVRRKK